VRLTERRLLARSLGVPLATAMLVLGGCGDQQAGTPIANSSALSALATSDTPHTSETDTSSTDTSTARNPTDTSDQPTDPGTTSTTAAVTTPTTSTPPPTASRPTTGSSPTSTPAEPAGDLKFGSTYSWADGISLKVGAPAKFQPTGKDRPVAKEFVKFDLTLTNNSDEPYIAGYGLSISVTASGGRGINTYDKTLPERPDTAVLPGQSASWSAAYGVAGVKNVAVQIAPNTTTEPVTFATGGTRDGGRQTGPDNSEPGRFVGMVKFGGSYRFLDGMTVTVSSGKSYQPTENAFGAPAEQYLQYDVTIVNGTRQTFDPGRFSYGMTEAGKRVGQISDPDRQIDQIPDGSVPPGHQIVLKIALGVTGTKNLALDLRIGNEPPVVFTNVAAGKYSTAEQPVGGRSSRSTGATTAPAAPSPAGPTATKAPSTGLVDTEMGLAGGFETRFGASIAWKNGVTVTVSAPKGTRAEPRSSTRKGARPVEATVVVRNGSSEPLTGFLSVLATSKQQPAETIIDSQNGFGDTSLSVEPGSSATLKVGLWVLDPADVIVQVNPGTHYEPTFFSTSGPQAPGSATPTGTEDDPVLVKFGQPFTFADRVTVTATQQLAIPVDRAAGDEEKTWLAISGTLTNHTGEPVTFRFHPTVLSANQKSEDFLNPAEGIGVSGGQAVLPGRSLTITVGYVVKDPKNVTAQFSYQFDQPRVVWTT
jgi:hypothetical protein